MAAGWLRRPAFWIAAAIFTAGILVYGLTMPPTTSFWDCGEFITTSHILGVPHQPGTPLYVLVGRCFDILLAPLLGVAASINFMSAFFSSLALLFVFLVIRDIARRADPDSSWMPAAGGVIGALFLMFSQTFWNNAIEAEVYGLAAFVIAFLSWLALRWWEIRDDESSHRLLYLVIYMLGLGVGFHLGTLLVYPGIFVLILFASRRKLPVIDLFGISVGLGLFFAMTIFKDGFVLWTLLVAYAVFVFWRSARGHNFMLAGSLLFLLGLSVHIYLYIRAGLDPAINQSQPDNFAALMSVLRREQYPPMNPFVRKADILWQIKYYYVFLMDQYSFISPAGSSLARTATFLGPIFLGLLGVIHSLWRARSWAIMLLVNYLINADLLNLYLNFTDHEVRDRDYFFSAAFLCFAIFIGIGAAALLRYMAGPLGKSAVFLKAGEKVRAVKAGAGPITAAALLIVVAALPALAPGHAKWHEHDRTHNTVPREYAWNLLAGLDDNAILFTNGDNDTFPIWYLQYVEGYRTDVTVVNLSLINLPWYIRQLQSREPALELSYTDKQIDQLQPAYYTDPDTGQQRIVYVKDYIVSDAIQQSFNERPIFFAVTIPIDNMERYYPLLQMEGLAFRLTRDRGPNDMPEVDSDRMLNNYYGAYDFTGLLSGDSDLRRAEFAELNGLPAGLGREVMLGDEIPPSEIFDQVFDQWGVLRPDVFLDKTTDNLLGNYPAGLVRAGYDFLTRAQATELDDGRLYDELMDKAEAAFELASRIDPVFPMVSDIYPLILVEKNRSREAVGFVDRNQGLIPPQDERQILLQVTSAMISVGDGGVVRDWMLNRIESEPAQKIHYQILFKEARSRNSLADCRSAMESWVARSGERDAEMASLLAEMEAGATVGGGGESPRARTPREEP